MFAILFPEITYFAFFSNMKSDIFPFFSSTPVITTFFAPQEIIGIAYDSGGITTSTITVPLVAALGVGLATSIRGRNPMLDGFGLIALASLCPIIFVLGYGILVYGVGS